MKPKLLFQLTLAALILASDVIFLPLSLSAKPRSVALPKIENKTIRPRILYIKNPRFPAVTPTDLRRVASAAAALVEAHFDIKVKLPEQITVRHIDAVFSPLIGADPPGLKRAMADFRNDRVNWEIVRKNLVKQIEKQTDPLDKQIEFARPYLVRPLVTEDVASFSTAVMETFKARLSYWTKATLADGHPVIGKVPGRPDLPFNEYGYWALMAKRGIEAEIILTNQLVASVEYLPIPVHTSIRGGITGGSSEYNPASHLGASVWVSFFPFLSDDPNIVRYRNGDRYARDEALSLAGAMLAHEMGHQLLHLRHPWSNAACLMRPAAMLDFAAWVEKFDPAKCGIGSSPAMQPGTLRIPIW